MTGGTIFVTLELKKHTMNYAYILTKTSMILCRTLV